MTIAQGSDGYSSQGRDLNVKENIFVSNPFSYKRVTADGQIKAGPGDLHSITVSPTTATPTAGLLTIYDSLTEAAPAIYSEWIFATDVGHTINLDVQFLTGLYVGYDGTLTNVSVTVSYR